MRRPLALLLIAGLLATVDARTFQPPANWQYRVYNGSYRYHLYVPTGTQAGQKYPMALGLHGCCWDGSDTASTIGDPVSNGWHTFSYNLQREPTFIVAPAENDYSASTLIPLCRSLFAEFPIDTQRVMLCGFSMGAGGVASLLSSNPRFFSCALYMAGSSGYNSGFATVPCVMGVGNNDTGMRDAMIPVATSARAANGDSRGPLQWETGVNPYFKIFPNTDHGGAMGGVFGLPGVVEWAYTRLNDGNRYPNVRFTQAPGFDTLLAAATAQVTVTADARDADGTITKVEFKLDGALKATVTSSPWTTMITGLTPGDHVITATACDNGTTQGKTIDKTATSTIEFGIRQSVAVATTTLPLAAVGVFFQDTLETSAGNHPFNWALVGGALPTGLTLARRGRIEGVPTAAGSYPFTVSVTDTGGTSASQALTIDVVAAPAGVVSITNIQKMTTRGSFTPWLCMPREPIGTTGGSGEPQGLYYLSPHPIYDAMINPAGLEGYTMLRATSLAGDISRADTAGRTINWLSFDISAPTTVHVAYPRSTTNGRPPWLAAAGFTSNGRIVKSYEQDYYDYSKSYPAGRVVLGPNDGINTGAGRHYLVIVESKATTPVSGNVRAATVSPLVRQRGRTLVAQVPEGGSPVVVRVLNAAGRVVLRRTVTAGSATVDLSGLAPGSYVAQVGSGAAIAPVILAR